MFNYVGATISRPRASNARPYKYVTDLISILFKTENKLKTIFIKGFSFEGEAVTIVTDKVEKINTL